MPGLDSTPPLSELPYSLYKDPSDNEYLFDR